MKTISKTASPTLAALLLISLPAMAHAAKYSAQALTNIYADPAGRVLIKWEESQSHPRPPNPGPCPIGGPQQNNYGWVAIPATANEALKALAISIYFGGHPARIDTSGCDGINESVSGLYSPGG